MSPNIGKMATRIALFLILAALFSWWKAPVGSAERVVSVLVIVIGLVLLAVVALAARLSR